MTRLAYGALVMAVAVRGGAVPGVIVHAGHGSEHTARGFRQACDRMEPLGIGLGRGDLQERYQLAGGTWQPE